MDKLSPELRAAETEIDAAYRSNPLMQLSFAVSAWNLLGVIEDQLFLPLIREDQNVTRFKIEALIDYYMFIIRQPVYWLRISCAFGGDVPQKYNPGNYQAALDLVKLALQYDDFCMVFTHASRGLIDLKLEGESLIPIGPYTAESQYEAYNRLVKPVNVGFINQDLFAQLDELHSKILPSLEVDGDKFSFDINPHLVRFTIDTLRPLFEQKFTLPDEWSFSRYSISDFRQVFQATTALAFLQYSARFLATQFGCESHGFSSSLLIARKYELLNRLLRYTGLKREVVRSVINDLTLGSNDIVPKQADPAQQPLILLNEDHYVIMPHLWINNAAERNFVVLLNKLPKEKETYLRLVNLKEELMRARITEGIQNPNWQTWFGSIPGRPRLPDIDLAIIDHKEKTCLVIELKWFIDPAEPREVLEKSEEVKKGISQLLQLKGALADCDQALFNCLGIDSTYSIGFAVVSANWIGHATEQHPEIPVIREHHFKKKISAPENLSETIGWLGARKYLPIEGVHYEIIETAAAIGKWSTKWYGIKALIEESEFLPL